MISEWLKAVHPSWNDFIESQMDLLEEISTKISIFDKNLKVIPKPEQVLRCLSIPVGEVRCIIVGQDPYPNSKHACGLAFAISSHIRPVPMSLKNIRKELISDCGCQVSDEFDLTVWLSQGVLLLNRVLTVVEGASNSHSGLGWEEFTSNIIKYLDKNQVVVAILWGNSAQKLEENLRNSVVIKSVHPSPLSASRGFFGSKPFSKANAELKKLGLKPINWCEALSAHK